MRRDGLFFRLRNARFGFFLLLLITCILLAMNVSAQIRAAVLEIEKGKVYEMTEDTLLVGELILHDSARLILYKAGGISFIKANHIRVGSGGAIFGKGERGVSGEAGMKGKAAIGICKDGLTGNNGMPGLKGENGRNLVIETESIEIAGPLLITLGGGTGGDGGNGGAGSAGTMSSIHCTSHGGNGGNGGPGGNGGDGGSFSIAYSQGPTVNDFCLKVNLQNQGGYQGFGGDGGKGGVTGEGASKDKSQYGKAGAKGTSGAKGRDGQPLFYSVKINGPITVAGTH